MIVNLINLELVLKADSYYCKCSYLCFFRPAPLISYTLDVSLAFTTHVYRASAMSTHFAFVTLLTSDSYLPGALAISGALKDVHQSQSQVQYDTVCVVTPETLDVSTIKLLRKAYDVVIGVEVIDQPDPAGLSLLGESSLR